MKSIQAARNRFHQHFGQMIFDRALLDFKAGTMKTGRSAQGAFGLSLVILATPIVLALFGLWVIWVLNFAILAWVVGLLFVAVAYAVFPRRFRNDGRVYSRVELPHLFDLLDQIAAQMYTTAPDAVKFDAEYNGFMQQVGLRRSTFVLGIGFSLWNTLTPDQRLAFLAHEMAHKVNNDPARGMIVGYGLATLENWYFFLEPDGAEGGGFVDLLVDIVLALLAGCIALLWRLLLRLTYADSQRAEYFADATSALVAGKTAAHDALEMSKRAPLLDGLVFELYPYTKAQGARIFDHVSEGLLSVKSDVLAKVVEQADAELASVDATHPPTLERQKFLDQIEAPLWPLPDLSPDWEGIKAELATIRDQTGKRWMVGLVEH